VMLMRAAASPDGKVILTASLDHVWLREAASGKLIGEPRRVDLGTQSIGFSPDGTMALVIAPRELLRLAVTTGEPIGEPLRGGGPGEIAFEEGGFTPDGERIYALDLKRRLFCVWEARTGKWVGSYNAAATGGPEPLDGLKPPVFSPDGKRFLVV